MTEPSVARDHDERGVKAGRSVLVEQAQILGAWRRKFVIVGGAVPWLLLPAAAAGHIGTLDIDLDLSPDALSDGEYATLVQTLVTSGYERDVVGSRSSCAVGFGLTLVTPWPSSSICSCLRTPGVTGIDAAT